MANYAASVLAEAQLKFSERMSAPEMRLKNAGVIGAFMKSSDIALPNLGDLRTKEERPEHAYFKNRSKRAAITSRTHNHTGTVSDSTQVILGWDTYGDKFQTSLKRSDNNVFADAEILSHEIENALNNIYEAMDADALAYLGTNKTAVNAATKGGVFDATADIFEIANGDINKFIQIVKSMLKQNFYSPIGADLILDSNLYMQAEFLAAQNAGNATNWGYQFSGVNLMESVLLDDVSYADGAGFAVAPGTIAMVDWIPSQNRAGEGDMDSYVGGFGTFVDPRTGLTLALHSYKDRADTSAAGGDTQDVVQEWEMTVDISYNKAPLTAAGETTIFGVGMIDTPANP